MIKKIKRKIESGERITYKEGLYLLCDADLLEIGYLADLIKKKMHPEGIVTYVIDRNINYTNVCSCGCKFCAFYRPKDHPESYLIEPDHLLQKIEETIAVGGTQILLQGGMHPDLRLDYYVAMLKSIKKAFPQIHVHGFSPPEIYYIANMENIPVSKVIGLLVEAGLDTIPGGGAEILDDEVRKKISPNKCSASAWLDVMKRAHKQGIRTSATMMFGHIESPAQLVGHLDKIRKLQDETGGFTAFICWTFQPANTRLAVEPATGADYLRVLALSRIYLDNIENIQASWVTQGGKIAQIALAFGANDFGSTMIEENVVAATGIKFRLPESEIKHLITNAGFVPKQRDCFYNILNP